MDATAVATMRAAAVRLMTDRASLIRPPATTLATAVPCAVWRLSGRIVEDLARRAITAAWGVRVPVTAPALRVGDHVTITTGNATGRSFTVVDVTSGQTIDIERVLACVERS